MNKNWRALARRRLVTISESMQRDERMHPHTALAPYVLTCETGLFLVTVDGSTTELAALDQVAVPVNAAVEIECRCDGALRIVCSLPAALVGRGAGGVLSVGRRTTL